jgi:hypothetical protein
MSLFDSASLVVTPNGQKAGKLYSIKPSDGSGDLIVTRATSATRVDANGLVEIPRTNLVLRSEEFDNTMIWPGSAGIIRLANQGIAPNGTNTMDLITFPVAGNSLSQSVTVISGATYTFSIWLATQSGTQTVEIGNINSGVYQSVTVTTTAQRFEITQVASSTNRFPAIRATANYSILIWGAQLEQGNVVTEYIPTVASIRTKFAGITQDGGSASNIPRLDYTNGSCPSILVEPQRTNLLLRSEEFSNVVWSKLDTTVNENSIISPDGTTNADTFTLVSSASRIIQSLSLGAGTYSASVYLKITSGTPNLRFQINIDGTSTNFSITGLSSGWQRFTVTFTATTSVGNFSIRGLGGVGEVAIWGAQMELGANATSYIPTTSASVTRNADVISKTGISSLIGQTEGTLFCEVLTTSIEPTIFHTFISVYGNLSNRVVIGKSPDTSNIFFYTEANGVSTYQTIETPLGRYKIALGYKNGNSCLYINGVSVFTSSNTLSFSTALTDFYINERPTGLEIGKFNLYNSALWKTRLTNSELAQLTTI